MVLTVPPLPLPRLKLHLVTVTSVREKILLWTYRVGSDARIDQLEGRSSESCLSLPRSHEGCPKHDIFTFEYSKCANL